MINFVSAWCEYSGESEERVRDRMAIAPLLLREEWRQMQMADALDFYRRSTTMIYDLLARAELMQQETWPKVCGEWLRRHGCTSVLDYGCGVGAMGIGLAADGFEVALADVESASWRFVDWLKGRAGVPDFQRWTTKLSETVREQRDAVVCLEVFEHLLKPEETATRLMGVIRKGGVLFASWSFPGEDSNNPLHLETGWTNESFQRFLSEAGGMEWLNPGPCWARVLRKAGA